MSEYTADLSCIPTCCQNQLEYQYVNRDMQEHKIPHVFLHIPAHVQPYKFIPVYKLYFDKLSIV